VQPVSAQPKQHVQKALMEYLLLGKVAVSFVIPAPDYPFLGQAAAGK
jgi:hypothetical protein